MGEGGNGDNGPIWMMPKHYLKQFHPKYGPNVARTGPPPAASSSQDRLDTNPDCPIMTGWVLKSYKKAPGRAGSATPTTRSSTAKGGQLPYVDEVT